MAIFERLKSSVGVLAILIVYVRYAMPLSTISDVVLWIEIVPLFYYMKLFSLVNLVWHNCIFTSKYLYIHL